jgi:imidazolonepropionase-like amidohydrolase
MTREGARNAVEAGVDSIEHGNQVDKETLALMASKGTFLVPTSSASLGDTAAEPAIQALRTVIANAQAAHVKIACGFDADSDARQGRNALELASLVKLGLTPIEAIRAATVTAADLMAWQASVGSLEKGKFADLIAVDGDPLADISVLQHVTFVMKGGTPVKRAGE